MLNWIRGLISALRSNSNLKAQLESIPGFSETFQKESEELAASRVRTVKIIGFICYSAFGFIDLFLYPHLWAHIATVRIGFAALVLVSLCLSGTSWWKKNAPLLLFTIGLAGDLGISYLASQISGWTSLYFVGNILIITGLALFVPWRPRIMLFYCLASLAGYFFINLAFHPVEKMTIIPLMFIAIISMQAYYSTALDEISRMKQLASRFEIEKAHGELSRQSDLLQQQIVAAKDIQQALLPPLKQEMHGIKIEALYEPSEHLSGDFFDAIVSGDWLYIYLADVTGHGLPAAQITFLVKEIFKTSLAEQKDLIELFDIVRAKYADHQLSYDLGLQLVRINIKTMQAEYLRSNSPNPVVIGAASGPEEIELPASPIISAAVEVSHREPAKVVEQTLQRGTKVYLYSDGAYEFNMASGREFGLRRLLKTLERTQEGAWPEDLRTQLISENSSSTFPDDLTVLRIHIA